MAADCKSADVSLRGCESLPAHILFSNFTYSLRIYILAIEFNKNYISIVMEADLVLPEEIERFSNECDEASHIKLPAVVLDFKNVKEINSAGLSKVLKLYKELQSYRIKLFMCNVSNSILTIFNNLMIFSLIPEFKGDESVFFEK